MYLFHVSLTKLIRNMLEQMANTHIYIINNFKGYNLKMIIIDDSVKIISDNAFKDCIFLKYVKFHNKLEIIQDYAFQYCSSLNAYTK